jgi:hypothetical protein
LCVLREHLHTLDHTNGLPSRFALYLALQVRNLVRVVENQHGSFKTDAVLSPVDTVLPFRPNETASALLVMTIMYIRWIKVQFYEALGLYCSAASREDLQPMKTRSIALACCLCIAAVLAYAQNPDEGFQTAQVVSFEKAAQNEQHPESADHYKIAMRMNGAVYVCRAEGPITDFMGWAPGKQFPAKLDEKEKIMLVKSPSGNTVQLNVTSKKR